MRSRIPATLSLLLLSLATPAAWAHYPLRLRATFWVFVDERPAPKK